MVTGIDYDRFALVQTGNDCGKAAGAAKDLNFPDLRTIPRSRLARPRPHRFEATVTGQSRRRPHHQCENGTGSGGCDRTPCVAPPRTHSRKRECPIGSHDKKVRIAGGRLLPQHLADRVSSGILLVRIPRAAHSGTDTSGTKGIFTLIQINFTGSIRPTLMLRW